jgi:glutamate-5-semialdehyde dehydrogenase
MTNPLEQIGQQAKTAQKRLAHSDLAHRNNALAILAERLAQAAGDVLAANAQDVETATDKQLPAAQIDRLRLTQGRIDGMIAGIAAIIALPDPLDRLLETVQRPNGLRIEKCAVPIGVIGIIFEARPNVAIDAAALCIKSGNACILRGGSDSWHSVQLLISLIQDALAQAELPREAVQSLPTTDRELVGAMLTLTDYIDVIVPRGGKSLAERVQQDSRMPVFSHLDGICHTYIDAQADAAKAVAIAVNAKMRRVTVCGASECLLLHKAIATTIGKDILAALLAAGCEVRVPDALLTLDDRLKTIRTGDYGHEFLDAVMAVAIVDDVEAAVDFINHYGSRHTDAIVTEDAATAGYFLGHVDSAIALHNTSTQFADGGEFGKGAEIGIATGKLHARGPVGVNELTTYQYRVYGHGQIRP